VNGTLWIRTLWIRTLGLLAVLALGACEGAPDKVTLQGQTMGTYWRVSYLAEGGAPAPAAVKTQLEDALVAVNASMSTWDPQATISQFNNGESLEPFPIEPAFATVVAAAQAVSAASGGAFDVTVGPLIDLWGFGAGGERRAAPPSAEAIGEAQARVGFGKLVVRADPPSLQRTAPGVEVDLSALAKGYGVDVLAAVLGEAGLGNYLVDIGGEVRARGVNDRGVPWRIGVEVPDPSARGLVQEALPLKDLSLATSGDYRNFFEADGVRYSHTIDPRTGYPIPQRVASVTVAHREALWADAWATAMNVLGPEAGLALAERQTLPVLFILYDGEGFERRANAAFEALGTDEG
jgi:thiamine biosynthesis lipoprotein